MRFQNDPFQTKKPNPKQNPHWKCRNLQNMLLFRMPSTGFKSKVFYSTANKLTTISEITRDADIDTVTVTDTDRVHFKLVIFSCNVCFLNCFFSRLFWFAFASTFLI